MNTGLLLFQGYLFFFGSPEIRSYKMSCNPYKVSNF